MTTSLRKIEKTTRRTAAYPRSSLINTSRPHRRIVSSNSINPNCRISMRTETRGVTAVERREGVLGEAKMEYRSSRTFATQILPLLQLFSFRS